MCQALFQSWRFSNEENHEEPSMSQSLYSSSRTMINKHKTQKSRMRNGSDGTDRLLRVWGSKGRPCRAGDVWASRRRRCGGKASEAEWRARPRGLETGAWRGSSESYNCFGWCGTWKMILGSLTFTKWHGNLQAELHLKCTSHTACRVEKSLEVSEGRWQRQEWNRDQWGDCCCQARGDEDLDLGGGRCWDMAES